MAERPESETQAAQAPEDPPRWFASEGRAAAEGYSAPGARRHPAPPLEVSNQSAEA